MIATTNRTPIVIPMIAPVDSFDLVLGFVGIKVACTSRSAPGHVDSLLQPPDSIEE